jgi:hypothetical protein
MAKDPIWIGIHPRGQTTRILATDGAKSTVLKAHLVQPQHRRALPTLLEALALWQGTRVRAVVVVDESQLTSETARCHDWFDDADQTPLYSVEHVFSRGTRRRHRDPLRDMGEFADLRQLLLFELPR